jgi:predicted alpha/beta superfamily hydrolase
MKYFIPAFLFLFTNMLFSQNGVCINNTITKNIVSKSIKGQTFDIQILLPNGFEQSTKTYPVIYLLDAQWDFPLLSGIYGQNYYDGQLPEAIIAGITWSKVSNYDSLRLRDFTPSRNKEGLGGGAEAFQAFLRDELFPYMEENYKAESHNRTLLGSSLGGLFAMYTLFTKPELATNYIAASPSVGWDDNKINNFIETYYLLDGKGPKKLYITAGELENSASAISLCHKTIEGNKYTMLQSKFKTIENTGHAGTKTETYARGLQYAFIRPTIHVHEAILEKYLGRYYNSKKAVIELIKENHGLTIVEGNKKYPLEASNENNFYSKSMFLNLSFFTNGLQGFRMDVFGDSFLFKK